LDKPFPAYDGDGPYVFVCYAHDDAGTVYPELQWLRNQGVNLWYDEGISPGAEFPEHIAKAILDASAALFYVSPRSVDSRHCRDEVYFALDRDTPVLACYLAHTELPAGLALTTATTQALMRHEMRASEYRQKLIDGVTLLLDTDRQIDAAPHAGSVATSRSTPRPRPARLARPAVLALFVALIISVAFFGRMYVDRQAEIRRVKDEMLPQIRDLVDERWRDFTQPYALAVEAEEIIPDDPELAALLGDISLRINIDSEPTGADVYMKNYPEPESEWTHLGVTPIKDTRVPVGIFRWKFEKSGYETLLAAASSWDISISGGELLIPNHIDRKLDPVGQLPPGMVRVAAAQTPYGEVEDFFVDRFEVTNAEFQRFVDAGGYRNRDYWQHVFVEDGRELTWEQGIARFVDQTGRPGPSTWLGGTFPDGLADHPVAGVSWYEAAAYARFAGKALPTGTHWGMARGEYSTLIRFPQLGGFAVFAPFSNFEGSGTVEVGSLPGFTAYGAFDLAGNVREWCANDTSTGKLVRGGAFGDNPYRFGELSQAPPMLRGSKYGFRTVLYPNDAEQPEGAIAATPIGAPRNFYEADVVSDEVFEILKRRFAYDDVNLEPRQETPPERSKLWTLERVSVATPYGDERMIVNLFLPAKGTPPYQTVIYFPGSASLFQTSSGNIDEYYEFPVFLSFLVKTGRAVAYPVYQGTFERSDERYVGIHWDNGSSAHTEFLTMLVKDFRRTIDYLETRPDIDADRLAFYGMSWGGTLGSIIAAVEDRVQTAIIIGGGLYDTGAPESTPLNYVSRVSMPFLILAGQYDSLFNHEVAVKPLYDLLGTPDEQKMMKVYETDHIPPKSQYVAEILRWLDLYLGPVNGVRASDSTG